MSATCDSFNYALPQLHPYLFCAFFPVSILTWLPDRLYLAAYIHPPTAETIFPYGEAAQSSPRKRSQRAAEGPTPVQTAARQTPYYFTVDDTLLYNAFHHDFGPLHIGHLYRFALQFHDVLGAKENKDRPIVFWSRADPRSESHYHIVDMGTPQLTVHKVAPTLLACSPATWSSFRTGPRTWPWPPSLKSTHL